MTQTVPGTKVVSNVNGDTILPAMVSTGLEFHFITVSANELEKIAETYKKLCLLKHS
jgi:hypothetical protein